MRNLSQTILTAFLLSAGYGSMQEAVAQSPSAGKGAPSKNKIGSFTSVKPTGQTQTIVFPSETHTFQLLAKTGETLYTGTDEALGGNNDFTAYIGKNGSSKEGYLSINQETTPGGVSLLDLNYNESEKIWDVNAVRKVDFSPLVRTVRNCSGGITPWGTVITSEETTNSGDANGDGYQDVGWQVEIDPATGEIMDYDGDGKPDKLWAMGRMNHENIAVSEDGITCYQAEDGGSSGVFKFVADQPGKLNEGTLYVLKRDSETSTTGTWVPVPNKTQSDRNNTRSLAGSVGGTNWRNPEDIEFGPDGKMYFTSKGTGNIWRFKDEGATVSEIEAWVTRQQYEVNYHGGSQLEDWGTGIDNLTFDGEGNLWALQDGGRNNLWVIRPDHTNENPHLELFMTTPSGSESTGLTFSPDYKFGFISIQHPSRSNTQTVTDVAGNKVTFNESSTIVFARKEHLGKKGMKGNNASAMVPAKMISVYPNPFTSSSAIKLAVPEQAYINLEVYDMQGTMVESLYNGMLGEGEYTYDFTPSTPSGNKHYLVRLQVNGRVSSTHVIQKNK